MSQNNIAVVILNYNGLQLMQKYLPLVISNSKEAEIIVADNGSSDGSSDWLKTAYPQIKLIQFNKNYGFAGGYNLALKQIKSKYYVLLNSDVRVTEDWLAPLYNYMENNPQCAACQPKIRAEKAPEYFEYAGAAGGYMDIYGYPFCRGRIMNYVEEDNGQYNTNKEIFWATGASLFIRSEKYWEVGGLDEKFFAHQEEIDLCWRLKARGNSIQCIPQSTIYHIGGGSLEYESPFKTKLNFRNNAILLYKNLSKNRYWYTYIFRLLLDWIAAIQMLLQKKPHNAKAIIEAQIEFLKMKPFFKKARKQNLALTTETLPTGLMKKWLIWQVYVHKKHKYSDL